MEKRICHRPLSPGLKGREGPSSTKSQSFFTSTSPTPQKKPRSSVDALMELRKVMTFPPRVHTASTLTQKVEGCSALVIMESCSHSTYRHGKLHARQICLARRM